jgi:nicotinate phosphoribosyltransferase
MEYISFDEVEKPTNSLVTPLLTDMYQISMAYAYWKNNKHNDHAVFELFFRKNPFSGEYCIFTGLDEVLKFLAHYE